MTRSVDEIARGLEPARAPVRIEPGERIHVVGAAGAGASAAAILAARGGAIVTGCDPGGPSPYTPALDVLGIDLAGVHAASHVTVPPRPDRLAVTKALTAVDPDQPELHAAHLAASGGQLPYRGRDRDPWRRPRGGGRHHGKSTTTGLAGSPAVRRLDLSAFVGAVLLPELTGARRRSSGWGRASRPSSRPTSTLATSIPSDR